LGVPEEDCINRWTYLQINQHRSLVPVSTGGPSYSTTSSAPSTLLPHSSLPLTSMAAAHASATMAIANATTNAAAAAMDAIVASAHHSVASAAMMSSTSTGTREIVSSSTTGSNVHERQPPTQQLTVTSTVTTTAAVAMVTERPLQLQTSAPTTPTATATGVGGVGTLGDRSPAGPAVPLPRLETASPRVPQSRVGHHHHHHSHSGGGGGGGGGTMPAFAASPSTSPRNISPSPGAIVGGLASPIDNNSGGAGTDTSSPSTTGSNTPTSVTSSATTTAPASAAASPLPSFRTGGGATTVTASTTLRTTTGTIPPGVPLPIRSLSAPTTSPATVLGQALIGGLPTSLLPPSSRGTTVAGTGHPQLIQSTRLTHHHGPRSHHHNNNNNNGGRYIDHPSPVRSPPLEESISGFFIFTPRPLLMHSLTLIKRCLVSNRCNIISIAIVTRRSDGATFFIR
jgi:hypothetical protein